eukprot:358580-Chlamydomonas_euryale.AAC.1
MHSWQPRRTIPVQSPQPSIRPTFHARSAGVRLQTCQEWQRQRLRRMHRALFHCSVPRCTAPPSAAVHDLRARLHHVHFASVVHHALHVLVRAIKRAFHRRPERHERRQQPRACAAVVQQRLGRVVRRPLRERLKRHRVIEPSAGKARKVFAVGVGAGDARARWRRVQRDALGGVAGDGGLAGTVGRRGERERAPRVRAHERLAHAQHELADRGGAVGGERVGSVQHKRVARRHHLLQQH